MSHLTLTLTTLSKISCRRLLKLQLLSILYIYIYIYNGSALEESNREEWDFQEQLHRGTFISMEKPSKLRSKLLRFLIPHAASAVTFQSPPLSPGKAVATPRGSSSPSISIIPPEVRRKPKTASFDAREPTSPKVSCMGHVKNTKKIKRKPKRVSVSLPPPPPQATVGVSCPKEVEEKKAQETVKIGFKGPKQGGMADVFFYLEEQTVQEQAPSLGQIKRFSSARAGALSNFDWRTSDVVVVPNCQHGYTSGPEWELLFNPIFILVDLSCFKR